MKDQYYKMPYGAHYLKCVFGTVFAVRQRLEKDKNDEWIIVEVEEELEPYNKNE